MANVDLSYLNEISGGDKEFIDEMINTFLEETPKDLAAIKEHSDSSNWTEVGKTAHKLKSSIKMTSRLSGRISCINLSSFSSGRNIPSFLSPIYDPPL